MGQIRWGEGGFRPIPKDPTKIIAGKVKGTKVKTLIRTMHTWTITEVDIMTGIEDKIKIVIGLAEIGIEMVYM